MDMCRYICAQIYIYIGNVCDCDFVLDVKFHLFTYHETVRFHHLQMYFLS